MSSSYDSRDPIAPPPLTRIPFQDSRHTVLLAAVRQGFCYCSDRFLAVSFVLCSTTPKHERRDADQEPSSLARAKTHLVHNYLNASPVPSDSGSQVASSVRLEPGTTHDDASVPSRTYDGKKLPLPAAKFQSTANMITGTAP